MDGYTDDWIDGWTDGRKNGNSKNEMVDCINDLYMDQ